MQRARLKGMGEGGLETRRPSGLVESIAFLTCCLFGLHGLWLCKFIKSRVRGFQTLLNSALAGFYSV